MWPNTRTSNYFSEDDDDDDYVEEISLVTKAEIAAREKDEKLKSAQVLFGSPDPSVPISDVPCSGCGAKLHCQDPGIPGNCCLLCDPHLWF